MPRKKVRNPPKLRKVRDKALRKPTPEAIFSCPECKEYPPNFYFCASECEWICCDCGAVLTYDEADILVPKYKLERKL